MLVLAQTTSVACAGGLLSAGDGQVTGLVGAAPSAPLNNSVTPAAGQTVKFLPTAKSSAGSARSAMSGSDGRYSITLAPGTYEVHLVGYSPTQLYVGRLPTTYGQWPRVTVVAGQTTTLDLIYDSAIR